MSQTHDPATEAHLYALELAAKVLEDSGQTEAAKGVRAAAAHFSTEAMKASAAPKMYEALKFFRDQYGDPATWPDGDAEALQLADEALRDAEPRP